MNWSEGNVRFRGTRCETYPFQSPCRSRQGTGGNGCVATAAAEETGEVDLQPGAGRGGHERPGK